MSLILCSECGNCLAFTTLAYQFISNAIRLEKLKESEKKDVEQLMVMPDVFDDEGKILDDLGLKNMCCRIHTLTHNSLNDIMAKHLHPTSA
jgi:DNA-directed RNA polymerase subunit N (RpoN/RPB10)